MPAVKSEEDAITQQLCTMRGYLTLEPIKLMEPCGAGLIPQTLKSKAPTHHSTPQVEMITRPRWMGVMVYDMLSI